MSRFKPEEPDALALDGRPEWADGQPVSPPTGGPKLQEFNRPQPRRRRRVADLEKMASGAIADLEGLLAPSGIAKRGSVLADLLYRSSQGNDRPDGFPTTSRSASPALEHPASQHGLRTGLTDALRRKREVGFAESSVEDIIIAMEDQACEDCGGEGTRRVEVFADGREVHVFAEPCKRCAGSGSKYRDVIGDAVDTIFAALEEVVVQTHIISKKRQVVVHAGDAAGREDRLENCIGCHRKVMGGVADRRVRGLCHSCYVAYGRWRIDNGTNDEPSDRRRFCEQRDRHEGHVPGACDQCADDRRKAADDWRLEVGHGMARA